MKRSIILSPAITLLAAPVSGFKQENLDKLKATNACEMCDPREANLFRTYLREANLSNVDLTGAELNFADLRDSDLHKADLAGITFCNTMMPDGSVNNADC